MCVSVDLPGFQVTAVVFIKGNIYVGNEDVRLSGYRTPRPDVMERQRWRKDR